MKTNEIYKYVSSSRELIRDTEKLCVNTRSVVKIVELFKKALYPDYNVSAFITKANIKKFTQVLKLSLKRIVKNYNEITCKIINMIPHFISTLDKDVDSIYKGDPSAKNKYEIINCYPGFFAIMGYRLSHELYALNVPVLPRAISEYLHSITGIDIHPGAVIGEYFCIDHGTGIVIGETTVIGNHVRIYHGVTLGTKGFKTDEECHNERNVKRHPNISDNVIIYANATILGGDTFIGKNCIVGTGAVVRKSVSDNTVVKKCPLENTEEHLP